MNKAIEYGLAIMIAERDRQAGQTSCEKVEVTPRMIEAGYEVLASSGRLIEGPLSSDRLLCSEVFQAMWNMLKTPPKLHKEMKKGKRVAGSKKPLEKGK